MKRFVIKLLIMILTGALTAQAADSLRSALDCDAYTQILSSLQPLADSGVRNADLYYNLGVCHFKLGNTGKAALWFLRAQNLNSAHNAAKANLSYIQELYPANLKAKPRPFLTQAALNAYDSFSLNLLAVVVLILALLTALSLHWLMHYPPGRERGLPILILSCLLFILLVFGSVLIVKNHRARHNDTAVVMLSDAGLFDTPTAEKPQHLLPAGCILRIQSSTGDMFQVILDNGISGWMKTTALERVVHQ